MDDDYASGGDVGKKRSEVENGKMNRCIFRHLSIGLRTLLVNFCIFCFSGSAIAMAVSVIGTAHDLQTDAVLYSENHCVVDSLRYVEYLDSDNQLIAHKLVDYESGLLTPSVVQHNVSLNDVIKVKPVDGSVEMQRRSLSQGLNTKPAKKALNNTLALVVDAGFDNFIKEYWDRLVEGEVVTFQFPAAARVDLFDFNVNRMNCSSGDKSQQCFNLRLDSWLLRMLVDPIELGYDKKSRQLKRFRGLANVENKKGNGYKVDIRYRYNDLRGRQCSADKSVLNSWL